MLTSHNIGNQKKKKVATSRQAKDKKKKEKKKKEKEKTQRAQEITKKKKRERELDETYVQVNMGIFVSQEIQNAHPLENILVGSGENTRTPPIFSPLLPPTKHPPKMFSLPFSFVFFPSALKSPNQTCQ